MNGTLTRPASKPQFQLIRDLVAELTAIGPVGVRLADTARAAMNQNRADGEWSFEIASQWIDNLRDLKRQAREEQAEAAPRPAARPRLEIPNVPAGRYALQVDVEDVEEIRFYEVEIADNGFVSCSVQASDDFHTLNFTAMVAVLRQIVEVGPKEASILYGKKLGVCGRCGATLTSKWRLQGIGPVCATKF